MTEAAKTERLALDLAITRRLGAFTLDVAIQAPSGVTALFGRSGAGKTSIAHAVAGLARPDAGRIVVEGAVLFDQATGVDMPPARRRVGYVFQEGRLFPHLTVRANLLFGRRFAPREDLRAPDPTLDDIARLLGIAPLLDRRPDGLSGGERQRVAIGRALLARPRLLIMDEPLASLDAARKAEILPYLERLTLQTQTPILYVSHAMEEVARLATTLVALSDGRVARAGPAAEVLADPSAFPLLGRQEAGSVLPARVATRIAADGLTELEAAGGRLVCPRLDLEDGAAVRVRVRARDVIVATHRPEGISALNMLDATIVAIGGAPEDAVADISLDCGGERLLARITRRSLRALDLAPGARCVAILKAIAVSRRDVGQFRENQR